MYNLYQSPIRKAIQFDVYNKDCIHVPLFGQKYAANIRERKVGPVTLQRIQVLGIKRPTDKAYIATELQACKKRIRKHYPQTIFVQFGMLNEIIRFENRESKDKTFPAEMHSMREHLRRDMKTKRGLQTSFRENMPQANIIYDVKHTDEELIADMNKGCKARVKKAIKSDMTFNIAPSSYYDEFYHQRTTLAGSKGFNTITRQQFRDLMHYLKEQKAGEIFIAEKDGELVAGSICMFHDRRITYLYGFANRKFQKVGGHHFLKFKIFGRARDHNIQTCDMLGAAPTGYPEHSLAGVSKFKESLGGTKIEMYGSYDFPIKPLLYSLVKWVYKRRG